ncbi:MAG TPA: hypothetical protein VKB38_15805 [Terracidiphilus sp.]|nr:hypothetical protein [Terracidiphilus sp.]
MNVHDARIWEIAAGAALVAGGAALAAWLVFRRRPTPEEIEHTRRQFLTQSGRIVDGTLLDVTELPGEDGHALTMLIYEYRIGGVDYECSQDITRLGHVVTVAHVRAGFPCSVRYQPGTPQNSIVVAENWSGLRVSVPVLPVRENPAPIDSSRLHPKTGS